MNKVTLEFEKPIREIEEKIDELERLAVGGKVGIDADVKRLRTKAEKMRDEIYSKLTRWQVVQLARHPQRPYTLDYIRAFVTDFVELHGDRNFRDDPSIVAGLGFIEGKRVAVIGHQKGRGTRDNLLRNFGMPHPEGYRKALRVMRLAEKFGLPIVTLIDTPGAYPGLGAEERGQAAAIAENLYAMAELKVPSVSVVIGEGGSGGALALAVTDRVYMLEYSIYSVISPEGCASILYRDASKAQIAAEALKITSTDLKAFGLVDEVIPEPRGGAHNDPSMTAGRVCAKVLAAFADLEKLDPEARIEKRIDKFAGMGTWAGK